MNMHEKVWRAIERVCISYEPFCPLNTKTGKEELADAVLDALYEPSPEMIWAAELAQSISVGELEKPVWQAMVKAIKDRK